MLCYLQWEQLYCSILLFAVRQHKNLVSAAKANKETILIKFLRNKELSYMLLDRTDLLRVYLR